MSGGFPLRGSLANGVSIGGVNGTLLATPASANTKGAYTQLVASTANDIAYLYVQVEGAFQSSANYTASVDIAVGAAGVEQIIIADMLVMGRYGASNTLTTKFRGVLIPLFVPAGTRISARCQMSTVAVATAAQVAIIAYDADFAGTGGAVVDAMGFLSASTLGTTITPGNGSKGLYAQLIASTNYDYAGLFLMLDFPSAAGWGTISIDVAVGAGGVEQIIIPDYQIAAFVTNGQLGACVSPVFNCPVPAGSRLSMRAQAGATNAFDGVLYGVRQ